MRTLYIEPAAAKRMPRGCEVFEVTPLLRELILRATELPLEYEERGPAGRVMRLLLDELAALPRLPYNLPMPKTAPLDAICARLMQAPNDPATLEDLAARHRTTARTLARHFRRQTGMSFAEWRRRARLLRALGWIAEGRPILAVALDLGYDSPSAFSAMFRRELGAPPSHFRGPSMSITGIVLAGGKGSRMGGVDKGLQPLRGKPMVEWVLARFAPQVTEIIINANQNLPTLREVRPSRRVRRRSAASPARSPGCTPG